MSYDMNGRVSTASHSPADGFTAANYSQKYLQRVGAVVGTEVSGTGGSSSEAFTVDALGNRIKSWGLSDVYNADDPSHERSLSFTTGLALTQLVSPRNGQPAGVYYKEDKSYDLAGNEVSSGSADRANINSAMSFAQRVSFYDRAEKLRVTERHLGGHSQSNLNTATDFGAYEEYRYDALGRRVFVISRGDGGSYTERTIWDGDQMLYQVRDPYPNATAGNGGVTGTVGYVHGGGLDHPLAVWRSDLGTVAPFADWRGVYALGSISTGQACCSTFLWPARGMTVDHLTKKQTGLWLWLGSLLEEGGDKSGLQYKRNRYFDPSTGRFTQEDPIGLAGGRNLYGFAGGDPVNFSDLFGLCPDEKDPSCDNYGGPVRFIGVQGSAILGTGVTGAAGVFTSGAGSGPYLRLGAGFGGDVAAGAEAGASQSLSAFRRSADGACLGASFVGACVSANSAGTTKSGNLSIGSRDIPLPISMHVERSYTLAPTTRDISSVVRRAFENARTQIDEFKRQAYQAMMTGTR